ncbi:MAG: radical SAM protein [Nanoarchaeota archaeon]
MQNKYVDLKLGYSCNNNCLHCVISNQKKEAQNLRGNFNRTIQEIFKELEKSKSNGCERVTITGGEPTIRNDFCDIINYAKNDLNFIVYLQTNGRMFKSLEFTKKTLLFIDFIIIALHSDKESIHDKITQRKNSFKETIDGIKNLISLNANIGIKIVISKYNYKDLKNILILLKSLKVNYVNIAFPHANGNALKYFDKVVPNYKDIVSYVENAIEFSKENNIILELEQVLPCCLNKNYDMKYFTDIKLKSNECELKQLNQDMLKGKNLFKKDKRKIPQCKSCIYNRYCDGFWKEYIEKRGYDEFKCVNIFSKKVKDIIKDKINQWK